MPFATVYANASYIPRSRPRAQGASLLAPLRFLHLWVRGETRTATYFRHITRADRTPHTPLISGRSLQTARPQLGATSDARSPPLRRPRDSRARFLPHSAHTPRGGTFGRLRIQHLDGGSKKR